MPDRELPSEVVARELREQTRNDDSPNAAWLISLAERLEAASPRLHLLPEGDLRDRLADVFSNYADNPWLLADLALSALHIEEEKDG